MEYPPLSPRSLNTHFSLPSLFLMQSLGFTAAVFFPPFLMPARFCKQITPSEPGGACPLCWKRRWNVAQTADWQEGTHGEKQDEVVDVWSEGWRTKGGRGKGRKGRTYDVEGKGRKDKKQVEVKAGERRRKKWVSFFVECPLGVAVSSQSGGLIRVRVWILSPWEASRRLIKTEVELKLDPQGDRGHNNGVGGSGVSSLLPTLMLSLSTPNNADLAQSVSATHTATSSLFFGKSSGLLCRVATVKFYHLW